MGKKGYLGKVVGPAVEAADSVIDKGIDKGTDAAKKAKGAAAKAKDTIKDTGTSARRAVAGETDIGTLERLAKLKKDGMLDDDEFRAVKARILGRL